jgi:hypothetical protein
MVWAHLLSMSGAMASPFDFRDVMKAHMAYDETRTVDQVLAEHKARDQARDNPSASGVVSKTPPPLSAPASDAQLEAARALLGAAVPNNFAAQE